MYEESMKCATFNKDIMISFASEMVRFVRFPNFVRSRISDNKTECNSSFQENVIKQDGFEALTALDGLLMALEIERKFLVNERDFLESRTGQRLVQGYICTQDHKTVRARSAGDKAWLTIKGPTSGFSRSEFEFEIPVADAEGLLQAFAGDRKLSKTRYRIEHEGHMWEVDVFDGLNAPLVLAEIELESEDEAFARPSWLGREVTSDHRYFNAHLAEYPYSSWSS